MLPKVLRAGVLALGAAVLMAALPPDAAKAQDGLYGDPGFRSGGFGLPGPIYGPAVAGVRIGFGFGYGYYGHPLDDSWDPPIGYGEYAEYGPWARHGYAGGVCQLMQRRVWTAHGLRWRTVRVCG